MANLKGVPLPSLEILIVIVRHERREQVPEAPGYDPGIADNSASGLAAAAERLGNNATLVWFLAEVDCFLSHGDHFFPVCGTKARSLYPV